jgi:hypothetical protein
MPEAISGNQSEHLQNQPPHLEQNMNVSTELTTYIDRALLTPIRERLASFSAKSERGNRVTQRTRNGLWESEYLPQDITRFEQMRQEVQKGNFNGIAAELQTRRAEPEARLAELRPQLRPRGDMSQDEQYFALKNEILVGERIREKVNDVLDGSEQAWIDSSIELRKSMQDETERGKLMSDINREQQTLNEITHLQQLISQPPQS